MQPPNPQQFTTPEALLDAIEHYIDTASAAMARDDMVELAGLDAVVDVLCARIIALPGDQAPLFRDKLQALHQRLDRLQQQMVASKSTTEDELRRVQARGRASKAYRKDEA